MKIAIASGKGGTGKTTVATNLAWTACCKGRHVAYLDCDVEEPNGHIFLKPTLGAPEPVGIPIPQVDADACTHCQKCGEICQYSAIVSMNEAVLVFAELCHGCGGCTLVCDPGAITEVLHEAGTIERGSAGDIDWVQGRLNVGQAMSPPVIRAVKAAAPEADLMILDAPPGTSCPVIESVRGCDYLVLVTEPTPFGLHDLKLAVDMASVLGLRFGVVINRTGTGDDQSRRFCDLREIPILAEVPDDRRIAEAYSRGEVICESLPEYATIFDRLYHTILSHAQVQP